MRDGEWFEGDFGGLTGCFVSLAGVAGGHIVIDEGAQVREIEVS